MNGSTSSLTSTTLGCASSFVEPESVLSSLNVTKKRVNGLGCQLSKTSESLISASMQDKQSKAKPISRYIIHTLAKGGCVLGTALLGVLVSLIVTAAAFIIGGIVGFIGAAAFGCCSVGPEGALVFGGGIGVMCGVIALVGSVAATFIMICYVYDRVSLKLDPDYTRPAFIDKVITEFPLVDPCEKAIREAESKNIMKTETDCYVLGMISGSENESFLNEVDQIVNKSKHVKVTSIDDEGIAESAGIKVGDVLLHGHGSSLVDITRKKLANILAGKKPDNKIWFFRKNEEGNCLMFLEVKTGESGAKPAYGLRYS